MKIWLSKNSEISVRQQLAAQILLGVASGDLQIGQKLPSTGEISRRFHIHSNTVSSAYQQLVAEGLLEYKQGSGFYVRENKNADNGFELDRLIAEFLHQAQANGFGLKEIRQRLENWFELQSPNHFLVVEPDEGLREILVEEIRQAIGWQVEGCDFPEFQESRKSDNAIFVALPDETEKLNSLLTPNKTCVFLRTRSVPDSMANQTRPPQDALIAVISGWENFLIWAKTILVAAQIDADSLILRSTKNADWRKGLESAAMIICDTLTAKEFSGDRRLRVFRVIADESLAELKQLIN